MYKSKINSFLFVFLSVCLIGLLFSQTSDARRKRPDWLSGTSKKYPSPRYFIGVGSASLDKGGERQKRRWAANRARGEIAKIIRSEIKVEEVMERKTAGRRTGRKRWVSRDKSESRMTQDVRVSSTALLEGVEIKDYYRDRKDRLLYALAVLDRVKASRNLEADVSNIKGEILSEMEIAEGLSKEGRLLPAISHYQRALSAAKRMEDVGEMIQVLKPAGKSVLAEAAVHDTNLKRLISGLQRNIRFVIEIEGPAKGVKSYVIRGLKGSGYISKSSIPKNVGLKVYKLKGLTDLTYRGMIDMGENMKMQIYQADLDLEIVDEGKDEVVDMLTWSVSANEKTQGMARKSAVRALGAYVESCIADDLSKI